jgi:MraZ protein
LGNQFILTIAPPETCLAIYSSAAWEQFSEQLESIAVKDKLYRRFSRHIFANTETTSCDAQGRLVIPAPLRAYAGIERDAVSIGFSKRIEIWSRERLDSSSPSPDEVSEFMTANGLL